MSSLQIISVPVVSIRQMRKHDLIVFDRKQTHKEKSSRVYPDTKYRRRSASCFSSFRSSLFLCQSRQAPVDLFLFLLLLLSRVRLVKCIDLRRLDFFRCRVCGVSLSLSLRVVNVVLVGLLNVSNLRVSVFFLLLLVNVCFFSIISLFFIVLLLYFKCLTFSFDFLLFRKITPRARLRRKTHTHTYTTNQVEIQPSLNTDRFIPSLLGCVFLLLLLNRTFSRIDLVIMRQARE